MKPEVKPLIWKESYYTICLTESQSKRYLNELQIRQINNNLNNNQMATATETPKPSKEQILALCVAVYPHTKSYDRTKEAVREILEISEALYNEQSSNK